MTAKRGGGYESSHRPVTDLRNPPAGPAPGARRTAGSLTADDLGRTVTVGSTSDGWTGVLREIQHLQWTATTTTRVLLQGLTQHVHVPADTPVHVHDEEAGR